MKNLIYILLLFLSVTACAQSTKRVSDYDPATDPDANDILYFIEDGVAKNITKSLLQQSLIDSIEILRGLYDNLMVEVDLIWDTIEYYHPPPDPESDTLIWNVLWLEDFEGLSVQSNLSAIAFRNHIGQSTTLTSNGMSYDPGDGHGAHYNVNIIDMDALTNGAGAGTGPDSRVWETEYVAGEYDPNHGHQFWITLDEMTDSVLTGVVGITWDITFVPGMDFVKEVKLMGFTCDSVLAGSIVSTDHPPADEDSTTAEGIGIKNALLGWQEKGLSQYEWYTGRVSDRGNGYARSSPKIGNEAGDGLWEFDTSDTIWYHCAMVTMYNSDNNTTDGEVAFFIDGVCLQSWNTSRIVSDITREIETLIFYTFYGGGDDSYDAPAGAKTWYDNLRIIKPNYDLSTYNKVPGVYFEIGEVVGFPGYPKIN